MRLRLKKLLHYKLRWGYPNKAVDIEDIPSAYPRYGCEFCDGMLGRDSQGNWFHLKESVTQSAGPEESESRQGK